MELSPGLLLLLPLLLLPLTSPLPRVPTMPFSQEEHLVLNLPNVHFSNKPFPYVRRSTPPLQPTTDLQHEHIMAQILDKLSGSQREEEGTAKVWSPLPRTRNQQ